MSDTDVASQLGISAPKPPPQPTDVAKATFKPTRKVAPAPSPNDLMFPKQVAPKPKGPPVPPGTPMRTAFIPNYGVTLVVPTSYSDKDIDDYIARNKPLIQQNSPVYQRAQGAIDNIIKGMNTPASPPSALEKIGNAISTPLHTVDKTVTNSLLEMGLGTKSAQEAYQKAQQEHAATAGYSDTNWDQSEVPEGGLFQALAPEQYEKAIKMPYGAGGIAKGVSSFATPSNLLIMAATAGASSLAESAAGKLLASGATGAARVTNAIPSILGKGIAAAFAPSMLQNGYEKLKQFYTGDAAHPDMNLFTEGAFQIGLGLAAAKHATTGEVHGYGSLTGLNIKDIADAIRDQAKKAGDDPAVVDNIINSMDQPAQTPQDLNIPPGDGDIDVNWDGKQLTSDGKAVAFDTKTGYPRVVAPESLSDYVPPVEAPAATTPAAEPLLPTPTEAVAPPETSPEATGTPEVSNVENVPPVDIGAPTDAPVTPPAEVAPVITPPVETPPDWDAMLQQERSAPEYGGTLAPTPEVVPESTPAPAENAVVPPVETPPVEATPPTPDLQIASPEPVVAPAETPTPTPVAVETSPTEPTPAVSDNPDFQATHELNLPDGSKVPVQINGTSSVDGKLFANITDENGRSVDVRADRLARIPQPVGEGGGGATAPTVFDNVRAKLDVAEKKTRSAIKKGAGKLSAGIPADQLAHAVKLGAIHIARGAVNAADYAAEMVKEYGDKIKPHLDDLWQKSKDYYHDNYAGKYGLPRVEEPKSESTASAGTNTTVRSPIKAGEGGGGEERTGIRQQTHEERAEAGKLGEIVPGQGRSTKQMLQSARDWVSDGGDVEKRLDAVDKSGFAPTADDIAAARIKAEDLTRQTAAASRELQKDPNNSVLQKAHSDAEQAELAMYKRIKGYSSAWSDQGRIHQGETGLDTQAFYLSLKRAWESKYDRPMTPTEDARAKAYADKIETLNDANEKSAAERERLVKAFTDLQSKYDELARAKDEKASVAAAQRDFELQKRASKSQQRSIKRTDLKADYEVLKTRLAAAVAQSAGKTSMAAGFVPDPETVASIAPIVRDMAKNLISQGVNNVGELVDKVHADVSDIADGITLRNVRDLISGYGIKSDRGTGGGGDAAKALAKFKDLQRQAELISKTEDVKQGIKPEAGNTPGKPSESVQKLQAEYQQALKDAGMTTPKTPPTMESRQAAVLKSLERRIGELNDKIKNRDFSTKTNNNPVKETAEIKRMTAQRDAMQTTYNRLKNEAVKAAKQASLTPGDKFKSEIARSIGNKGADGFVKAVGDKLYNKLVSGTPLTPDEQAKLNDAYVKNKPSSSPSTVTPSAAMTTLRTIVDKAKSDAADLAKANKPPLTPEQIFDRRLTRTLGADGSDAFKKSAGADLVKKLVSGSALTPEELAKLAKSFIDNQKPKSTPADLTGASKVLQDAVNAVRKTMPRSQGNPLDILKKNLQNQIDTLTKKSAAGDYAPDAKRPATTLDAEAQAMKGRITGMKTDMFRKYMQQVNSATDNPTYTPEQTRGILNYAKENYIDKGVGFNQTAEGVASDLGMKPEWVKKIYFDGDPNIRAKTAEMMKRDSYRRAAVNSAQRWMEDANKSKTAKVIDTVLQYPRSIRTLGHAVAMVTHAGTNIFDPNISNQSNYWRSFIDQFKYMMKPEIHEQAMQDLVKGKDYDAWNQAKLAVDPDHQYDSYQNYGNILGEIGRAGNRSMDALKVFRLARANAFWDGLDDTAKSAPGAREEVANLVNHMTGTADLPSGLSGVGKAMFAPSLEISRWARMLGDPYKTARDLVNPNATAARKAVARVRLSRAAQMAAVYTTALLINKKWLQATGSQQQPDFDPRHADFYKFQGFGKTIDPTGNVMSPLVYLSKMASTAAGIGDITPNQARQGKAYRLKSDTINYLINRATPVVGTAMEAATQHDFMNRPLPFSPDKGDAEHPKYTWPEYISSYTPIPVEEGLKVYYETLRKEGVHPDYINAITDGILSGAPEIIGFKLGTPYKPPVPTRSVRQTGKANLNGTISTKIPGLSSRSLTPKL